MSIEQDLHDRSGSNCELCGASDDLAVYEVPPAPDGTAESAVLLCACCREQVEDADELDVHHWHCLNDSAWSEVPAVQVMAWRLLQRLSPTEGWASDLLDSLYLEDDVQEWAESAAKEEASELKYLDANGVQLAAGDTVTVTKDLDVKGGSTAKRGTPVRNIRLVPNNAEQIEGRVNGQVIIILTKFVKKVN